MLDYDLELDCPICYSLGQYSSDMVFALCPQCQFPVRFTNNTTRLEPISEYEISEWSVDQRELLNRMSQIGIERGAITIN